MMDEDGQRRIMIVIANAVVLELNCIHVVLNITVRITIITAKYIIFVLNSERFWQPFDVVLK